MAHISKNNIITINRGDSFSYLFYIDIGYPLSPQPYILQEGDKLYLGVCEPNQFFEAALIKKVFTIEDNMDDGSVSIDFEPTDTLDLLPGNYYYSIKLSRVAEGKEIVTTVIPRTKFILIE